MPDIPLEEMMDGRYWTRTGENVLVSMLVASARSSDLSDSRVAKDVIEHLSDRLTRMFCCPITPMDITKKLQSFNNHFVCFYWFISRDDILYEAHSNRVFSLYRPGVYVPRETEIEHTLRVVGEPFYYCFDHLFRQRRMDELDYNWLYNIFLGLDTQLVGEPVKFVRNWPESVCRP